MALEWWLVLICAAVMLYYSVAHYTLRNASRVKLESAFADRGGAGRLAWLDRELETLLSVTAAARALAIIVLVLAIVRIWGSNGGWWTDLAAMATAAAIVLVVGVGIPNAWAKYAGEGTVAATWWALVASRYAFWPLGKLLAGLDVLVRRLSGHQGIPPRRRMNIVEEEIVQLATEGQAEGALDPDELEMIESVIEFRDLRAGEVMTPLGTDIRAIEAASTLQQCREAVVKFGHSRLPVYEGSLDRIAGVLYAKDLLRVDPADAQHFTPSKLMRKPFFVPQTKTLHALLKEFKSQKVHIAIVLDEYGGTAGLVTIEDLLEQIVGQIADEYEPAEPAMLRRIDEQAVEVDARMYIDDLNDELSIHLPEDEDYDTVGGFVFSHLGYIPQTGERFEHAGMHFTIVAAEARKINRIRIELPKEDRPSESAGGA